MVDRNLKQWRSILEYANLRRQASFNGELVGEVDDGFEYYRSQILSSIGVGASQVVQNYDHEQESEQLAASLQGAVARFAATETGALGVGAAVGTLATTVAVDVTGFAAANPIAGLGLYILPDKRRKARNEFHENIETLRERLDEVVEAQLEIDLEKAIQRMRETLARYETFVRSERERMNDARSSLSSPSSEVAAMRETLGEGVPRLPPRPIPPRARRARAPSGAAGSQTTAYTAKHQDSRARPRLKPTTYVDGASSTRRYPWRRAGDRDESRSTEIVAVLPYSSWRASSKFSASVRRFPPVEGSRR